MNLNSDQGVRRLMAAAKVAVRLACRVTTTLQASAFSRIVKSDASPVTVADFAVQAIISIVLQHELALPSGTPFRMMGEEDEATFAGGGYHPQSSVPARCSQRPYQRRLERGTGRGSRMHWRLPRGACRIRQLVPTVLGPRPG